MLDGGQKLRCPKDLFDPHVSELRGLLEPNAFPSREFWKPAIIPTLRTLGLQSMLTLDGVLQSATSIEQLAKSAPMEAVRRGEQLTRYLDFNASRLREQVRPANVKFLQEDEESDEDSVDLDAHVASVDDIEPFTTSEVWQTFSTKLKNIAWLPVCVCLVFNYLESCHRFRSTHVPLRSTFLGLTDQTQVRQL